VRKNKPVSDWSISMKMMKIVGAVAVLFAASTAASVAQAATYAYVSNADSKDISVFSLDEANGAMTAVETIAVGGTVMPLALSPDHLRLYAGLRSTPYSAVSFAVNPLDGKLFELGRAPLAESMAYVSTDASGRYLFSASYGGNMVAVNRIGANGVVGDVQQTIKTGPMARARQPRGVRLGARLGCLAALRIRRQERSTYSGRSAGLFLA
jgi:6-phosphogluconolactonase